MNFLTYQRDTDLLILSKLEDRDLLNICLINKSANKLCNDDNLWKNLFLKKWGNHFKSEDKSWKKFYLLILKYLNTKVEIDCNYLNYSYVIPHSGGDFLPSTRDREIIYLEIVMEKAVKDNQIDVVNFMTEKGAKNFDDCLTVATRGGNLEMVKFLVEKGAKDLGFPMSVAAANNYIDTVKFLIDRNYREKKAWIESIASCSSISGNIDMVKLMFEKGAKNFKTCIKLAKEKGHTDILDFLNSF